MLLDTQQELSPIEQELNAQLYETFAPRYSSAEGAAEEAYLTGGGGRAAREAEALAREFDPEYYNIRAKSAGALEEMLAPGLTGGESTSIERGLNRSFGERGISNLGNNTQQFEAAATYGGAARDRLGSALQQATSALPNLRNTSGALIQSNAKSAGSGARDNPLLRDIKDTSDSIGSTSDNLLNNQTALRTQQVGIDSERKSVNEEVSHAAGSVCCFIFLESYNGTLPWFVRYWRDRLYVKDQTVAKGYIRMAKLLVPLMRRFRLLASLVNMFMVTPITQCGGYVSSVRGYEEGKHKQKYVKFWMKIWKFLGR